MTSPSPDFLIDSNVFVYAFDAAEPAKRERAISVIELLADSGNAAVSVQVLGEVYNVLSKRSRLAMSRTQCRDAINEIASAWLVCETTVEAALEAARCAASLSISYWDALIWSVARENGIRVVLSEDMQDGQLIEGVRIMNPLLPSFDMSVLTGPAGGRV